MKYRKMIKTIISLPCKVWAYCICTLAFFIYLFAIPACLILDYLEETDENGVWNNCDFKEDK